MMFRSAVLAVMLAACASTPTKTANPAQELRYTVELKTTATTQSLAVEVTGSGFASGDSLVAYLPNWGEWTELGRPYIQNVTLSGRPVTPAIAGTIPLGTGPFVLRYELPVIADTSIIDVRRHSLLPRGSSGTAVAAVRNTLVEIRRGGARVTARESIRLVAPSAVGTFTGWAGFSAGSQSASVLPVGVAENGFYAFGVREPATRIADGVRIEVVSVGAGARRVNEVVDIASRVLPMLHKLTGVKPDSVVRVIMRESGVPEVLRGTASQFGISIALPPEDDWSETIRAAVAHEFSHLWIGRRFPGEGLLWFMEGFNDYLALLAATASGVVTPEWFAQRLARISDDLAALPPSQPRALTAPGMVARDNDGPAETMAYRGGALAAFGFDVALRASNKGTIGDFVGRLLTSPHAAISEQAIHDMAGALGVTAQFNAAVGASRMTSPWEALRSIGYVFTEEPASLQALGIAADAAGRASHLTMGPAVVRAIDPNGPSAAADIVPGDTVIIRINRRSHPPIHVAGIAAATLGEYTFASSVIPSNAQQLRIQVRRSGETRTVTVTPRAVSGGVRFAPRWDASNGSSFFKAPVTR